MATASFSETSVAIYQSTRHTSQDCNFYHHCRQNLKSHNIKAQFPYALCITAAEAAVLQPPLTSLLLQKMQFYSHHWHHYCCRSCSSTAAIDIITAAEAAVLQPPLTSLLLQKLRFYSRHWHHYCCRSCSSTAALTWSYSPLALSVAHFRRIYLFLTTGRHFRRQHWPVW